MVRAARPGLRLARVPQPVAPDRIARPYADGPVFPQIPIQYERLVNLLANALMIEFRAERGFSSTENLLRDPELSTDRRAEAEHAAEIVNRIRIDEKVRVDSLRLYLGEHPQAERVRREFLALEER